MKDYLEFYIDGQWVPPVIPKTLEVINPATEETVARISIGSAADVHKAVAAARKAFEAFSRTSKDERIALLKKIATAYKAHIAEIAETISTEMGAPAWLANRAQAPAGLGHVMQAIQVLETYPFSEQKGATKIVKDLPADEIAREIVDWIAKR